MKRNGMIILTFCAMCLAALTVQANTWGALKDLIADDSFTIFASDKLVRKQPIRYAVSEEISPEEEAAFVDNIRRWPDETREMIRRSGRGQEFADVTSILHFPLTLRKVTKAENPDIYLYIGESAQVDCKLDEASGCFGTNKGTNEPPTIVIMREYIHQFDVISLHEIGHFWGLSDQYQESLNNSHPRYSTPPHPAGSVMSGNYAFHLSCDDADGLINVIDIRRAQYKKGVFSGRANAGWKSLCPESDYVYQRGEPINLKSETAQAEGQE